MDAEDKSGSDWTCKTLGKAPFLGLGTVEFSEVNYM